MLLVEGKGWAFRSAEENSADSAEGCAKGCVGFYAKWENASAKCPACKASDTKQLEEAARQWAKSTSKITAWVERASALPPAPSAPSVLVRLVMGAGCCANPARNRKSRPRIQHVPQRHKHNGIALKSCSHRKETRDLCLSSQSLRPIKCTTLIKHRPSPTTFELPFCSIAFLSGSHWDAS